MNVKASAYSRVRVQITSADLTGLLLKLNNAGIVLYQLKQIDFLTVAAEIEWKHCRKLLACSKQLGAHVKFIGKAGFSKTLAMVRTRWVLLFGCFCVAMLTFFLPRQILMVEVEGNNRIPTQIILERAAQCGIHFGTSTEKIRSENIKNALLSSLPELQWAGINTYGCRAVISVKERSDVKEPQQEHAVTSIVAACDGIIESFTALQGTPMCQPGQAVKTGDVLISGFTDCGMTIRATRAVGDVFAETTHALSVIMPMEYTYFGDILKHETTLGLIFGKKRINLFKDSGILVDGCVKMYRQYPLMLPGGAALPVTLVVEDIYYYECSDQLAEMESCRETAFEYAKSYLLSQMISGRILNIVNEFDQTEKALIFRGVFSCSEMIGRVRNEGITSFYGKSD